LEYKGIEMFEQGHNGQLKSIVERINSLMDSRDEVSGDIRDVFAEAKGSGYDIPALRAIVRAQREDAEKRRNRESMIDLYRGELGIE
jgi:uncharacterized protein (UPF0335 family)